MKKKIIALTLAMAMLCGMTACSNQTPLLDTDSNGNSSTPAKNTGSNTTTAQSQYAYSPTYIPINLGSAKVEYVGSFCISGDQAYFYGECIVGEEPTIDEITGEPMVDATTGEPYTNTVYETKIFRLDLTTGQVTELSDYKPEKLPDGYYGSTNLNNIFAGSNGTIWLTETTYAYRFNLPEDFNPETDDAYNYYESMDNENKLIHMDKDGKVLQSVTMEMPESGYYGSIIITEDGTICSTDWTNILLYGEDGKISATIPMEDGDSIQNLISLGGNRIACQLWREDGNYLAELDLTTKTLGDAHKLVTNAYAVYPGRDEFDYTYENNGTFYGCKYDSQDSVKLFSWLDNDIDSSNFNSGLQFTDDGRIYTMETIYNYSSSSTDAKGNTYNLIIMEPVDPSTIPVKQQLTLACFSLGWDLRSEIIKFNKSHDDIRIVVNEYSQYATDDDYTAGLQKLNTEILSGNVPDLFLFNTYDSMPVQQYIAKGILMDLWPLIDSDPELSREDLMTHFFDTLAVDGKLYQLTDSFTLATVAGKTSVVGNGQSWTMDDLTKALNQQPEGTSIFSNYDTKDSILQDCVARNAEAFIDWSTAQCHFDSQEFIDLLTFANQFPAEISYDDSGNVIMDGVTYDTAVDAIDSDASRLRSGKQMLYRTELYTFQDYLMAAHMFGEDVNFIGYPTTSGSGNSFNCYSTMAISTKCSNVDAAWSFLRTFLTEDYQTKDYWGQFPTNKHSFDTMAKQVMTKEYETDPETGKEVESPKVTIWFDENNTEYVYAMTQQELDTFMALYNNTDKIVSYDQEIYDLITAQTEAFFNGQKTAEETAKLIQSSVSLYVFENA